MPQVFIPPIPPQSGPTGQHRFNVTEIRFGEGYTSSYGEGLNNKSQVWPLTWKGTWVELQPIKDFLDEHEGFIKFWWTPPAQTEAKLWVCKGYDETVDGLNGSITATFEQRFAP